MFGSSYMSYIGLLMHEASVGVSRHNAHGEPLLRRTNQIHAHGLEIRGKGFAIQCARFRNQRERFTHPFAGIYTSRLLFKGAPYINSEAHI